MAGVSQTETIAVITTGMLAMKKTAAALVLLSVVLCTTAVATKPHIVFILVEYVIMLLRSAVRPSFC